MAVIDWNQANQNQQQAFQTPTQTSNQYQTQQQQYGQPQQYKPYTPSYQQQSGGYQNQYAQYQNQSGQNYSRMQPPPAYGYNPQNQIGTNQRQWGYNQPYQQQQPIQPGMYDPNKGSFQGIGMYDSAQQGREWEQSHQQPQYNPNDPSIDFIDDQGRPHYNPQYGQNNNNNNNNQQQRPPQNSGEGPPLQNPNQQPNTGLGGLVSQNPGLGQWGQQYQTQAGWNTPWSFDQYGSFDPTKQGAANNWGALDLQYQAGRQGAFEYGSNLAEQKRQFDAQMGRQTSNDEFERYMALTNQTHQFDMDKYGQTADQRNFNQNVLEADRQYNLSREGQQSQIAIQNRQAALAELTQQQRNMIDQGQLNLAGLTQQQRNAIDQGNLALQQKAQRDQNLLATRGQDWQERSGIMGLNMQQQQIQNQNSQWQQDFGLRSQDQTFGQGLQTSQLKLAQKAQADDYAIQQRSQALAELTQQQRNALDKGTLNLATLTQQQRNAIEQGNLALAGRNQSMQERNQLFQQGMDQKKFSLDDFLGRGQLSLQQTKQAQDNAINQGQLALSQLTQQQRNALETGQLNLATLTQQQRNALEQAQLAQDAQLKNRGYDIQETGQQQQYGIQQQQLAQQLQIEQMRLQAQREQAALTAGGRLRARNTNWLRAG